MKLKRSFYLRQPLEVARDLLGKHLIHITPKGKISGRIVEVEAYGGEDQDLACHGANSGRTERNKALYDKGGFIYIYLIYGMYHCFNAVTSGKDIPAAVLVRSIEPVEGIDLMIKNRGFRKNDVRNIVKLTNGPGKLSQAMGFGKNCYGIDLCGNKIFIKDAKSIPEENISYTSRINIDYAGKAKNYPWRLILNNSKFLSV